LASRDSDPDHHFDPDILALTSLGRASPRRLSRLCMRGNDRAMAGTTLRPMRLAEHWRL
jgi:hypothetical protein